jgi:hypothetical protein
MGGIIKVEEREILKFNLQHKNVRLIRSRSVFCEPKHVPWQIGFLSAKNAKWKMKKNAYKNVFSPFSLFFRPQMLIAFYFCFDRIAFCKMRFTEGHARAVNRQTIRYATCQPHMASGLHTLLVLCYGIFVHKACSSLLYVFKSKSNTIYGTRSDIPQLAGTKSDQFCCKCFCLAQISGMSNKICIYLYIVKELFTTNCNIKCCKRCGNPTI